MAASGTYTFAPTIQELIDEAFERCGIDPEKVTGRHLRSARFSINLMFSRWAMKGVHQWTLEQRTITLTTDDNEYDTDTRTTGIFDMILRRDGIDTPMVPYSRDEYLLIPDKTITGRPDRFFFNRHISQPTLSIWPAAENSTDAIIFWQMRRLQDVTAGSETPDVRYEWYEAFTSGLADGLAGKFAQDKKAFLKAEAEAAFKEACIADRDTSSTLIRPPRRGMGARR